MKVIVTIEGREAIPVRAIPLLTDWKKISPDFVARIFAGDEKLFLHLPAFESLCAYQLNSDGSYVATEKRAWESWVVRGLDACSTRIKETHTNYEVGYQQWRQESWTLLPSGVFVWRDEFEAAYQSEYGPDSLRALANRKSYDAKAYRLNFSPEAWGLSGDWREVLMEGFAQAIVSTGLCSENGVASAQSQAVSATVLKVMPEWTKQAQSLAREYINSRKKLHCYPSQIEIADHVANELRSKGVVGEGGKPLKGSYIKRHALKGISSARHRQLSISNARGK